MIGNDPQAADRLLRSLADADVLVRLARIEDKLGLRVAPKKGLEKLKAAPPKAAPSAPEGKK